MTKTKASSEIYSLDISEVENLNVRFVYNFFTHDEGVNEDFIDESKFSLFERNFDGYVMSLKSRVPRFAVINFKTIESNDDSSGGYKGYNLQIRKKNYNEVEKDIIKKNLDKVISEDHFSTGHFSSVQFKGGEIKDIAYNLTKGSISQFMYDKHYRQGISNMQKSRAFAASFDQTVDPTLVMSAMADSDNQNGVNRFNVYENKIGSVGQRLTQFDAVKEVYAHGQVNNKVFSDFVSSLVTSPFNPSTIGLKTLFLDTKQKRLSLISNKKFSIMPTIPYIDISTKKINLRAEKIQVKLAGYVVDKVEILKDKVEIKDQIVIEGQQFGSIIDFNIKYGSTYMYAVRAIYKVDLPVYDETLDKMVIASILISSRPSGTKYINCIDPVSPKSPSDFTFHWDNENDRVMLRWSFPLNTQRDIKKFQVFRRKTTSEAFELIKQYNFNDSLTPVKPVENPNPSLIEVRTSPKTIFFDDEFGKDSRYIYAVVSVDAHELTSEYSDQFEVWFDRHKNKLCKKLISHSGAPKQYPNLFIEKDLFVDTIQVEKKDSMSVYFTPDFYEYIDNEGNKNDSITTNQYGGSYKLSVINLDNQKQKIMSIYINDRRQKTQTNERPAPFTGISRFNDKSKSKGKF